MVRDGTTLFTGKQGYEKEYKKSIRNNYGSVSSKSVCVVLYSGSSGKTGGK